MIGTSSLVSFTPVLQQGLDLLFQYGLGLCAYQLGNLLAVLEEQDGGDVADAELYCQLFVLLDVALGASMRQGPHHVAQKSTTNGCEPFFKLSKFSLVIVTSIILIYNLIIYNLTIDLQFL